MYTTANFATDSKLAAFFTGGLNQQVEHHLFPNICHVHYKKLSKHKTINNTQNSIHSCSNDEIYYTKMLVRELKDILRANKCKVGGKKAELVARICSKKVEIGPGWIDIV